MSENPRVKLRRGPYVIVPNWINESGISDRALRLWTILYSYADRETGSCWPHRATLAKRLRVSSSRTVDRYMKELVKIGCVEIEHRFTDSGAQIGSVYHLFEEDGRVRDCSGGAQHLAQGGSHRLLTREEQEPVEQEPMNARTFSFEVETLSGLLADRVQDNHPTRQAPTVNDAWLLAIDRIIRIDGFTYDQVRDAIFWATDDDFWMANIRSAKKLRKQLPTILLQMQRKTPDEKRRSERSEEIRRIMEEGK